MYGAMPPLNSRRVGQTRLPIRVPVDTEPIGLFEGPGSGEAQNLSRGGMLLRVDRGVTPGVPVRVTLRLSQHPPLTLAGSVVWSQPHPDLPGWALGIRFTEDLPGEMVAEIADAEYPPWKPPSR